MAVDSMKRTFLLLTMILGPMAGYCRQGVRDTGALIVDHRYRPSWWQTLICAPDDPVKTLIGKDGQLLGDYGYEGPRNFSFSIQFDSGLPAIWESQRLIAAKIPIVHTIKRSKDIRIDEIGFVQIPPVEQVRKIVRFDSRRVMRNWSKPSVPCDKAFRDVAYGSKTGGTGIVAFHIKVPKGSEHTIALGFCEGEMKKPGYRVMSVQVEGASQRQIDPVQDFGPNKPGVYFFDARDLDLDGILTVFITNLPGGKERDVFVNGIWMFKDNVPSAEAIISGKEDQHGELYVPCAEVLMPERIFYDLITIKNTSGKNTVFNPVIRYRGIDKIEIKNSFLKIGDETIVSGFNGIRDVYARSEDSATIRLKPVYLKPLEEKKLFIRVDRFYDPAHFRLADTSDPEKEKDAAIAWWERYGPYADMIKVPDEGIQQLIESCIRNIYQARDIRAGKPSFNVGPTKYRGLWVADGTFILETATMLNDVKDVRNCIDYLLRFQLKGGGFNIGYKLYKENGLVIYLMVRHAMLTQDKEWLLKNWRVVEGCMRYIHLLHEKALENASEPYYGLLPPGGIDGGIRGVQNDYSNTEWCLSGMKWAIEAAKWLGKDSEAVAWQNRFDTFLRFFTLSVKRSLRQDDKGNVYLPVLIDNDKNMPPPKGQWAFCQSVWPGRLFDDRPELNQIAKGTLDMLDDCRKEGLVANTGWLSNGLWSYFTSFYGHALEWLGRGSQMPPLLYAFANHASPTLVWREEQMPRGMGSEVYGDMPHNWASAEFIRMVVHMIELDRGNELHLFEGLPQQWIRSGEQIKLNGIRTPFGRINLALMVDSKGDSAKLKLRFLDKGYLPSEVVIHPEAWGGRKVRKLKATSELNTIIAFHDSQ